MSIHTDVFGTTAAPCPDWCGMSHGHGWDSLDDDGISQLRSHEVEVGTVACLDGNDGVVSVAIVQLERLTIHSDGVGAPEPAEVARIMLQDDYLSACGARQVALVLLEAADRLDAITAGARR